MKVDHVLAPNPGPFTGPGTNTWIVSSQGMAIVVDPGPEIASHAAAIRAALDGLETVAVLVTHNHPDHAPMANGLAAAMGVPAIGFGPGPGFSPDRPIADGESVSFGSTVALCVATPGHTPDSVCFRVDDALFTGDHIMGGSTVVVEDMSAYLESLHRLQGTGLEVIYPGHGPVIDAPDAIIAEYVSHRLERERQILGALGGGASTLGEIVLEVYRDLDPALRPAAAMSVTAHLMKLVGDERVRCAVGPMWDSPVELA